MAYFTATSLALKFIIIGMDPSGCNFSFYAPVGIEGPGISVANSRSNKFSLIPVIAQISELDACNIACKPEMADIVKSTKRMHGKEMPCCSLAKPITCFGLYEPVFPSAPIGK